VPDQPRETCHEPAPTALGHEYSGPGPWLLRDDGAGIPQDAPLPALLVLASRLMGAFYGETVRKAEVKVSPAGLGVLQVLVGHDGLKTSEVAAVGGSSRGTLTAVVNTLAREGYVERRPDEADRRVIRLHATAKGRAVCEQYAVAGAPLWRHTFDFVPAADEPAIRRFFVHVITQFSKLAREERGT
jgi:MarR family transcriptional regulator, organic hydroperoxide resistance regulator